MKLVSDVKIELLSWEIMAYEFLQYRTYLRRVSDVSKIFSQIERVK